MSNTSHTNWWGKTLAMLLALAITPGLAWAGDEEEEGLAQPPTEVAGAFSDEEEEGQAEPPTEVAGAFSDEDDEEQPADPPTSVAGAFSSDGYVDPDFNALDFQGVPEKFRDPAFAVYIKLDDLAEAWRDLDPKGLTDAALQLAHGEKVLYRQHKGISADEVFRAAIRVAGEKKDKESLDRLAKAVEGRDPELKKAVAAQRLASASRSVDSRLKLSVSETSAESFAIFKDYTRRIAAARVLQDREMLEGLKSAIDAEDDLGQDHKSRLKSLIDDTAKLMPEAGKETAGGKSAKALDMLAGGSRGWFQSATGVRTPEPIRKIAPKGISVGGRKDSGSGLAVYTPGYIRSDGVVVGARSNTAQPVRTWRARITHRNGYAYWYDPRGEVRGLKRAPSRYDQRSSSSSGGSWKIADGGRVYYGSKYVGKAQLRRGSSGRAAWVYRYGGRTIYRYFNTSQTYVR